jgi:hypothetical protein
LPFYLARVAPRRERAERQVLGSVSSPPSQAPPPCGLTTRGGNVDAGLAELGNLPRR